MPTNRRRRIARRRGEVAELDISQTRHLLHGDGYFRDDFADLEQMRAAWNFHRDTLMAEFAERYGPGLRPFCWWLFEGAAKYGERPVIRPDFDDRDRSIYTTHGILQTRIFPRLQESEYVFLRRVGELGDDEWRECQRWLVAEREDDEEFNSRYANGKYAQAGLN